MNLDQVKKSAFSSYEPAIVLERIFPHARRHTVKAVFGAGAIFATIFSLFVPQALGIAGIFLVLWIVCFCLDAFYYSYYYAQDAMMSFELAQVVSQISGTDIVGSFLATSLGQLFLFRLGISGRDMPKSTSQGNLRFTAQNSRLPLADFCLGLMADRNFDDFLFAQGIHDRDVVGAADWLERDIAREADARRWWSERHLQSIPALGRAWSYGRTYRLDNYERPLPQMFGISGYGEKELAEVTMVLSRADEGNVLLVGDDEESLLGLIARVHRADSRVILLDNEMLSARSTTKQVFENEIIGIMREAVAAGNIILAIGNFAALAAIAQTLGSDIVELLGPYVRNTSVRIIATSSNERFHQILEPNTALMERFEVVRLSNPDQSAAVGILENESDRFAAQKIFFSYPALATIAESAERYFPDGVMPDKAIDLLAEMAAGLVSRTGKSNTRLVTARDVTEFVKGKTGIPMGQVSTEEKDKLSNLETLLHARIVGQDEAVTTIANAVRRARSGIENPNRPMASFLFLGPTGVGKTETTKALGDVFFGNSVVESRFDMSEYSGPDALSKLIGSFENNRPGTLSTALREHPYGVLFLDEFEKSTKEVRNLFLQILDEGFFSDMSGHKVLARNVIIIATSNAGSDLIWQAIKEGRDLSKEKESIISEIIAGHDFSPELLNRFDGIILFHPLSEKDLHIIAGLMLEGLRKRLSDRGVKLIITDALVNFVASYGTDPVFGARPMNRAIQDVVESKVAEKMIAGESKEVSFEAGDFT